MIMKIGDVHPIIGMEVHWAWNLKRILNYLTCSLCVTPTIIIISIWFQRNFVCQNGKQRHILQNPKVLVVVGIE